MDDRLLARLLSAAGAATLCLLGAGAARGSGVDIPALYGARYGGMGGAALAQVDEPSAVLHNPAGLAGVRSLALSGAVTLALTNLQTNPDMEDQSLQTGNTLAPG